MRVAVVGAGAAGLTAARTLTGLGHEVIVFEKEDRVGGKVYTLRADADSLFELGAVVVTEEDYPITLGYAKEFGIPTVASPISLFIVDEAGNKLTPGEFLLARYTESELAAATANYAAMVQQFAHFIAAPGLTALHPDLSLPFRQFAQAYGIEPVAELARALIAGFGYGYYESVPAAYYVKFMPFLIKVGPTGLRTATRYVFPTGFQSVFDALAATLDVRLSSEVTHIERPPVDCTQQCRVTITVNGADTYAFDAVVIATPLTVVSRFLDLTPLESRVVAAIKTNRYFVTAFGAYGLEPGESLYFYANAYPDRINHVGAWASRPDPYGVFLGNGYQIAERHVSAEDLIGILAGDVAEQGGAFAGVLVQQEWPDYFPHVGPEAIKRGIYDLIDAAQGRRRTYFVGSSYTFETVEHAARHARGVIQQHFGR